MLRNLFLIIILTLLSFSSFGQVHDQKIRRLVLRKGVVGKTYVFGKWSENGDEETHLTYLGKVKTKSGHIFKIMNSSWFWGISRRATSRILVFNVKNQYVGDYALTMTYELPTSLEKGSLIFHNTDSDCDKNAVTVIDLKSGLPKEFFRKCRQHDGDFYGFESF
ncbi:MAG TPA: hypothetical protein VG367_10350 [Mucilaginibacter sp.]|jgi:hypothetical protein|nr:hypothetical protein [Mucilaginibacter sp.]